MKASRALIAEDEGLIAEELRERLHGLGVSVVAVAASEVRNATTFGTAGGAVIVTVPSDAKRS